MSFQNQGFWMGKSVGCVNSGDDNEDPSRSDAKRSHQWIMDAAEAELFPNKKQAVGIPTHNLFTGLLTSNIPPWGNPSSFQSITGQFTDRLFDPEPSRTSNFDERNIASVSSEKFDGDKRKIEDDPFGNTSSFGLSMSHTLEDQRSGINYSGIRKVKVSQVKESEGLMPVSLDNAYSRVDCSNLGTGDAYEKRDDASMSMCLAYPKADGSIMSVGESFGQDHSGAFISMGHAYSKGEDNNLSVNQSYKETNESLVMGHGFPKAENNNLVTMPPQAYTKVEENNIAIAGNMYSGGGNESNISSMGQWYNSGDMSCLSMGQSYSKGESTIISFGGYDEDDTNTSGRLLSSYELLSQTSIQGLDAASGKELGKSSFGALVSSARGATASGTGSDSKKKDDAKASKKAPPNNFPSNVRSLLSTGILDGCPVKYVAWSREKELRGIISGTGYLCSCQSCNLSKVINAFEFERHANCKTKHPNNHIYFDNGKTIYGVVQELRSTPQHMLFDVIQTITGCAINQKSFRLWKGDDAFWSISESFLAATRELQRIYGKDEMKPHVIQQ
ncbi:unnamed protein product [Linum tenue]|uniref:Tify domain-containing protein n=1 Tax=Linum tenue TaxID=586396 RepID=A0AAV0PNT2_9ROSI|nr:unnamed protein product [Linum tenue]